MNKQFKFFLYVILIFLAVLYFYNLSSIGLLDVDETRHAEIAREMLEKKSYIVSYFNYEPYYNKPIFFYYLEILSMKIFGVNEFAARFPSLFTAFLCAGFLFYIVKTTFTLEHALISVIILLTSVEYLICARLSILDMTFSSLTACSMFSYFLAHKNKSFWFLIGAIFLALATLTKGPAAVILLGIVLIPFLFFVKGIKHFLLSPLFYGGIILFFLITLPWYFMVHIATGGEFTREFFGTQNILRFTSVVSDHSGPFYYYFPVVFIGFLPWIFFLPSSVKFSLKNLNELFIFSICFIFGIFIFFSVSKTKLPTYILCIYPALSIIISGYIYEKIKLNNKNFKSIFSIIVILFLIFYFIGIGIVLPEIDKKRQKKLRDFSKSLPQNIEILTYNAFKPSIIFYSKRKIHTIKNIKSLEEEINKNNIALIIRKKDVKNVDLKNLKFIDSDYRNNFYVNY